MSQQANFVQFLFSVGGLVAYGGQGRYQLAELAKQISVVGDVIGDNLESVRPDAQVIISVLVVAPLTAVAGPSGLLPAFYR
jgi:hypothetical protein